jgi:hypothetical protein
MMTKAGIATLSQRARWPRRAAVAMAAALTAIGGAALVAAPNAHADTPSDAPVAFEGSANTLWASGLTSNTNTGLAMWPGTSPSVVYVGSNGTGWQMAFQGSNGDLWTTGVLGTADLGLGMMAGTSPAITNLGDSPSGRYEIAFQANTGQLWTTGSAGTKDWGLPMAPRTSPSIASQPGGNYEVAYQSSTTELRTAGTAGAAGTGLGMQPGTSPSIIAYYIGSTPGYAIAFQANTGTLWTTGTIGTGNTGMAMNTASSPSLVAGYSGGYTIAFESNTNMLSTDESGTAGPSLGLPMRPGTSPSVFDSVILDPSGFGLNTDTEDIKFQGANGDLWDSYTTIDFTLTPSTSNSDSGIAMNSQSSPDNVLSPIRAISSDHVDPAMPGPRPFPARLAAGRSRGGPQARSASSFRGHQGLASEAATRVT